MQTTSCPPRLTENTKQVTVVVCLLAGLALGGMLFFLNPATTWFFPPCLLHKFTGLYCPGCGSTRALHCLLHGEVYEAMRNNALIVLALPLVAGILVLRAASGRPATASRWRWVVILLAVLVLFGVVRNIRRPPFTLLAPPVEAAGK
jgi:Protein of unknown function (DUF2752)